MDLNTVVHEKDRIRLLRYNHVNREELFVLCMAAFEGMCEKTIYQSIA